MGMGMVWGYYGYGNGHGHEYICVYTCMSFLSFIPKHTLFQQWGAALSTTPLRDFFVRTQTFEHCAHPAYLGSHLQHSQADKSTYGNGYVYEYVAQQIVYVWMQVLASTLYGAIQSVV
ncbi:hypothetical protein EON63_14710 [archaeon]|nr:MAG: hypothetical protein EON63_14710 [archaeon]